MRKEFFTLDFEKGKPNFFFPTLVSGLNANFVDSHFVSEQRVSSLIILRQDPKTSRAVESFLGHRGWVIYPCNGLKNLIILLAQKTPEYLLLPLDFPHKKIGMLPTLLAQAFPVRIIVYVEKSQPSSIALLHGSKHAYRLYPPLTGPSVERMIFKIQRDDWLQSQKKDQISGGGSLVRSDEEIRIQEKAQSQARDQLVALLSQDGGVSGNTGAFEESPQASGISVIRLSGENVDPQGIPLKVDFVHQTSTSESAFIPDERRHGDHLGHGEISEKGSSSYTQPSFSGQNPWGSGHDFGGPQIHGQVGVEPNSIAEQSSFDRSGQGEMRPPFEKDTNLSTHLSNWSSSQTPFPSQPEWDEFRNAISQSLGAKKGQHQQNDFADQSLNLRKNNFEWLRQSTKKWVEKGGDSIFVKGTTQALKETVRVTGNLQQNLKMIERTKKAFCIVVDSEKFRGYLIAVMGDEKRLDRELIEAIRQKLFAFLRAHGEVIPETEEAMEIHLREVEFNNWALEQAEFLRRAVHDETEIAMAFFPTQETTIKIEQSASERMVQLDLNDLSGDTIVDFDLYLYLPQNRRFLLYTAEGSPLYQEQKERLKKKGVAKMHIRKENVPNLKRYRAQTFLNEKIREFESLLGMKQAS